MKLYIEPERKQWASLCERPADVNPVVKERVSVIIDRVRKDGDKALEQLAMEIDGRLPKSLKVSEEELEQAAGEISPALKEAIRVAADNIRRFHQAQMPSEVDMETAPGVRCIQKPVPIQRVGLYIPGGTAPLFSTVLMLAIPAKIAGCKEISLCSPAGKDGRIAPAVLYAAKYCGVDNVYCVGGAQAIAAMAYGTESIAKVDKIFGPGNQWVTTAKQMVSGNAVSIDMPAGPSEVMVIADSSAKASFAAADLLSQAEHGKDSQVILLCDNVDIAKEIEAEVMRQIQKLGRAELAVAALEKSRFVVMSQTDDIIDFANLYAPEHLIISTQNAWKLAEQISNVGSVFIGNYTPESAGDYASGTNHTLPTSSWAHSCSGVNLDSFLRKITIQQISREGLNGIGCTIMEMAAAEGLDAHANAVRIRLEEDKV